MKKFFVLIAILVIACQKKEAPAETFLLKPKEFQQQLAANPDARLIDVRTMEEVQEEHIKGELNLDIKLPQFDILIQGLDKTKAYFVYCAAGVRSEQAAEKMRALDFKKVYTLEGGLKAWKSEGLPTQGPKPATP